MNHIIKQLNEILRRNLMKKVIKEVRSFIRLEKLEQIYMSFKSTDI